MKLDELIESGLDVVLHPSCDRETAKAVLYGVAESAKHEGEYIGMDKARELIKKKGEGK